MNWVDISLFVVLLLGTVTGFVSGLWWQVARLVILFVSAYATIFYHQPVGEWLAGKMPQTNPIALKGLAYFVTFGGVYLVLFLVAALIEKAMKAAQLKPMDRVLGGALGLIKGGLISGMILLGIVVIPIQSLSQDIHASTLGVPVLNATRAVILAIPEEQKKKIADWFEAMKKRAVEGVKEAGKEAVGNAIDGTAPPPANGTVREPEPEDPPK